MEPPEKRPIKRDGSALSPIRYMLWTLGLAAALATGFVTFAPSSLSPDALQQSFSRLVRPSGSLGQPNLSVSLSKRIGIVAGHSGNDSGAVCADGLTEATVNRDVAERVRTILEREGYTVDLLDEYDARLKGYRALALVSIHADSCEFINDQATGFKAAASSAGTAPEDSRHLLSCLIDRYAARTGMAFHAGSITRDMTSYHTYSEIDQHTPAAIIETGFLYLDRAFLTQHADLVSLGIAEGLLCFVRNEPLETGTASP